MPEHHKVLVVRITDIEKHPNADTLGIVRVGGYQVIVKLNDFTPGDLAVYVPPDSVVPQEEPYAFLWADKEFPDGLVPEKYRRITVRRFRKEWSEGLLMPVKVRELPGSPDGSLCYAYVVQRGTDLNGRQKMIAEGDDVAEFLGITHYDPPEPEAPAQTHNYERGVWPRSLKGWWYFIIYKLGFNVNGPTGGDNERAPKSFPPVYDVENLKNFPNVFEPGEPVLVTEKIHGSNARYTYQNGKMCAGSRKLWKSAKSRCIWRRVLEVHPWIEQWCREHEGHTLYCEVVPTQKGFNYGYSAENPGCFVFDVHLPVTERWGIPNEAYGISPDKMVPHLFAGSFDLNQIKPLVDGQSQVPGANHIREGCVIRALNDRPVRGLGRAQLKLVSNKFLEKDNKN